MYHERSSLRRTSGIGPVAASTTVQEWTSPLREIERAAQDQAQAAHLDMSSADAAAQLRRLLVAEADRWRDEYRKGRRPLDIADPDAAVERALRNLTGYGPLEPLLDDPDVWEIMVNGPGVDLHQATLRRPGATTTRSSTTTTTWFGCSPRSWTTPAGPTASSIRPRACRTPSSTTVPASTSCTPTSAGTATSWSTSASSPGVATGRSTSSIDAGDARSAPPRVPQACVRQRSVGPRRRGPGIGEDHAAVLPARPSSTPACGWSSPRRSSRQTSRCRTLLTCRPARPGPTAGGRPAPPGRGLPPHGTRRRHRRRGAGPGGPAVAA